MDTMQVVGLGLQYFYLIAAWAGFLFLPEEDSDAITPRDACIWAAMMISFICAAANRFL